MSPEANEQNVYDVLKELGIEYSVRRHPPVFTVEEAEKHWGTITGAHCKNLFLRNKKGSRHYLVVVEIKKTVDLKSLAGRLGADRLSFASPVRLMRYLGLTPGSVSPFGLINDKEHQAEVVVDSGLQEKGRVNFHPNVNTVTVGISYPDFERFLEWCGNKVHYLVF
ncbi:MAG: prolyl-tRNA synthetase associated domain-containing protein [Candidatus Aminicenantes bacterium]|nr:prolyl-tRNA synthetase associated domain-containing protein [Candidatus Aminicenantes bacterium]